MTTTVTWGMRILNIDKNKAEENFRPFFNDLINTIIFYENLKDIDIQVHIEFINKDAVVDIKVKEIK